MKKIWIPLLILFFTGSLSGTCAQAQGTSEKSFEQTEKYFKAATEDYVKKEYKKAGDEVRKASAIVKQKAQNASADTKASLEKSGKDLDRLADNLEKDTVKSEREMKDAFARTDSGLAKYYHEAASESYAKKEYKKAGAELKASAEHLKSGMSWAGHKVEKGTESVLQESRNLGDKMITGTKTAAGKEEKGMAALGDEIKKFGEKLGI